MRIMKQEKEIGEVLAAYERVKSWLADAVVPGGTFERDGWTYRGLFKAPLALGWLGFIAAANRAVDALKNRLMKSDGDFYDPSPDPHSAPSLKYFYIYRTSWITMGVHRLGRYDVSRKTGRFVLSYQDPKSGGFFSLPDRSPMRRDLCGTAQATLAVLALGEWSAAERAGEFLLQMLEIQPDNRRFYYVLDRNDRVVTNWPADEPHYCVLLKDEPCQESFPLAIAMKALAHLYNATGEKRYLRGAESYFDILSDLHEDTYVNPACGKLARGSAMLYHLTGNKRYREASLRAAQTLCQTINREPILHLIEWYPDMSTQPEPFRYELAFEYSHALRLVLQYLGNI